MYVIIIVGDDYMYIQYSADKKYAYFNGYKFTKDIKTDYYLSSTINGKRYRLHMFGNGIMEQYQKVMIYTIKTIINLIMK